MIAELLTSFKNVFAGKSDHCDRLAVVMVLAWILAAAYIIKPFVI